MMNRILISLFLLSLSLLSRGQASYDSSFHFYYYDQKLGMFEQMADRPGEVVWLGDSITDGCEWSELFPGITCLNRGISSDITFGVLNRIGEVTRRKPAKIFLLIGINDIARGIPDSVILRNITRIADSVRLHSPRTRLYIQSLLPTNNAFTNFKNHQNKTEHVLAVNQGLRSLCQQRGLRFVDIYNPFTDAGGKLDARFTNDGLHLTGAGYAHWKAVLLKNKCL